MLTAKQVMVLSCPAGNLWELWDDQGYVARVTYHGNTLVAIRPMMQGGSREFDKAQAERAIEAIYKE